MTDENKNRKETVKAFKNPKVGDHFHRGYTHHVFVVGVENDNVVTVEGTAPSCTSTSDGKIVSQTKDEFIKRHSTVVSEKRTYNVSLLARDPISKRKRK